MLNRIAIAQISEFAAGVQHNSEKIIEWVERAAASGAELVVFPELTIPGYLSLDHFRNERFLSACEEALMRIASRTKALEIGIVVGYPRKADVARGSYNSAALIYQGKVLHNADKTLIPDYDVFWENRYFEPSPKLSTVNFKGTCVGCEICEDLWDENYDVKVTDELIKQGARLIVNISASPFHVGKSSERYRLIEKSLAGRQCGFIYTNLVGAQDGYQGEVVFDGGSVVFGYSGKPVYQAAYFKEELAIVDLSSQKSISIDGRPEEAEIFDALTIGIRSYFERTGFQHAYLGISGGIDSAVVAALAVEALDRENVRGITLPSHITSNETLSDAILLCANLGIALEVRPIAEIFAVYENQAKNAQKELARLTRQNYQARIRGNILMEYANQDTKGLLLNTGNKTEFAMGYSTLYGDMCGALSPLGDVSKMLVYKLAEYINKRAGTEVIPRSVIERVPTAELEEGQTDRANLPADYPILSPLVDDIISEVLDVAELKTKYPKEVVEKTLRSLHLNEYKRRQAPPAIRVTPKAFGAGRRYPIDGRFFAY